MRRGRLPDAIDLCQSSDQPWRAATLRGGSLSSDPFIDSKSSFDAPLAGNPNRMLWKSSIFALSQDPSFGQYERSLYASLCGDLYGIQPSCLTWEDHCWAYFTVLVEQGIDIRMLKATKSLFSSPKLELSLPIFEPDLSGFFDSLIHHESDVVR